MPRPFTESEIIRIFSVLATNQGNLNKTSRDLGISRNTIKKLTNDHKSLLEEFGALENKAVPKVDGKVEDKLAIFKELTLPGQISKGASDIQAANTDKLNFIRESLEAKRLVLARITEMIPMEFNMDILQKTLRTLHDITKEEEETDPAKDAPGAKNISYLQIINNNLIQAGYGLKETDQPIGDQS